MTAETLTTANAGQTRLPVQAPHPVGTLDFTPMETARTDLPPLEVAPEFAARGVVLTSETRHFLPGVTAAMLDWFWGNMEKGYYLWAPGSHRSFRWVDAPGEVGFLRSSHLISETFAPDAPAFGGSGMHIHRLDPAEMYPFTTCLAHVICEGTYNSRGELCDATIHMWQDTEGGLDHIKAKIRYSAAQEPPEFILEMLRADPAAAKAQLALDRSWHSEYETAMWPRFLPGLYDLWKDHPDPAQSIRCDLAAAWDENGRLRYLAENGPAV